jgi:hypothetical protein
MFRQMQMHLPFLVYEGTGSEKRFSKQASGKISLKLRNKAENRMKSFLRNAKCLIYFYL